jgi:hypothetical protein
MDVEFFKAILTVAAILAFVGFVSSIAMFIVPMMIVSSIAASKCKGKEDGRQAVQEDMQGH